MLEKAPPIKDKRLQITSELHLLAEMRRFLRETFHGIPSDPVDRMELAANEVTANIIKHAYQGLTDQPIAIRATVRPDRICVSFFDRGRPFSPEAIPEPLFDGSQEGGFGLFIVAQVVDQFHYLPDEEGNRTTLCILLP